MIAWAWIAALTFVVLATSAILRARARKLMTSRTPGGVRGEEVTVDRGAPGPLES